MPIATWTACQNLPLTVRLPMACDLMGMAGLLFVQWRAALGEGVRHDRGHGYMASCGWTKGAMAVIALRAEGCAGPLVRNRSP